MLALADLPLAPEARVRSAFARALTPEPVLTVAEWAQQRRFVADESGSARPGKWDNSVTPFAVEIMDCLDAEHPARVVTLKIAAQLIKSEIILNWLGAIVDTDPKSALLVLPSLEEIRAWNTIKWEPMIAATPSLRGKVFELIDRSGKGSTTNMKRFRGGFLSIVSGSASKGLQMRSVKAIAVDELTELPDDAGGRGDPVDQAITRGDAHPDLKVLLASTPGELPHCRISARYEASDQRRWFVGCTACHAYQALDFEKLQPLGADDVGAVCASCGVVWTERDKRALNASGVWLKCYTDADDTNPAPPAVIEADALPRWRARPSKGRDPGFWLDQAASPFKPWRTLWAEAQEAERKGGAAKKTFQQQKRALAWDPTVDAPDHAALFEARGQFVKRGRVPAWACLLTGAADVQNDRLEWAAYAWGPDGRGARIDWGVIEGDTLTDAPWAELAQVAGRRWPGEATAPLGFDAFGIDSGGGVGRTAKVYAFVRRSPGLRALKGLGDPRALPLVEGREQKVTLNAKAYRARVWLVGTSEVKKIVYASLAAGLDSAKAGELKPNSLHFTGDTPEEHFKQLTAEVYREPRSKRAGAFGVWERLSGRANEQLDLAVYCYALAWSKGLERFGPAEWGQLFAARAKAPDDLPLLDRLFAAAAPPAFDVASSVSSPADANPDAAAASDKEPTGAAARVEAAAPVGQDAPSAPAPPAARLAPNPGARRTADRLARLAALNAAQETQP